jgi:hypothetical protein
MIDIDGHSVRLDIESQTIVSAGRPKLTSSRFDYLTGIGDRLPNQSAGVQFTRCLGCLRMRSSSHDAIMPRIVQSARTGRERQGGSAAFGARICRCQEMLSGALPGGSSNATWVDDRACADR